MSAQASDDLIEQAQEVVANLEDGDMSATTCAQAVEVIRALLDLFGKADGVVA